MTSFVEIVEESRSEGRGYHFLDRKLPNAVAEKLPFDQAMSRLNQLVVSVQGATASQDYADIRGKYIALNRALNFAGVIAPRFRPTLRGGPRKHGRTWQQNLISNDHQVLDLEWLSLQSGFDGQRALILPTRWQGLFGDELDLEVAELFVGTAGSAENKAKQILLLDADEQVALRSIQTERTRSWWRQRMDERGRVLRAIVEEQSRNSKLRGKQTTWPDIYLASRCGEFTGLSAPVWAEMITGKHVPPATISSVNKRVERLLGTRSPSKPSNIKKP